MKTTLNVCVFFLVVFFGCTKTYAFQCEGWQVPGFPNECRGDALAAMNASCSLHLNINYSHADGFNIERIKPKPGSVEFTCAFYRIRSDGSESGIGANGGNTGPIFCPQGSIFSLDQFGTGGCFVECDSPLSVEKSCPVEEENTCKKGQGSFPVNYFSGNKLFTETDYS